MGDGTAGHSVNKGGFLCRSEAGGQGTSSSFSALHGGEMGRRCPRFGCWLLDLQQGSTSAALGSFITAAASSSFFLVDGRPLPPQVSVTVVTDRCQVDIYNLQADMPLRRPFGSSAVRSRLPVPSGLVPGDGEVDYAELQLHRSGEGAGPDCIHNFLSEVLSAYCRVGL